MPRLAKLLAVWSRCLTGQRAICSPGKSVGGTCTVQPSCSCVGVA